MSLLTELLVVLAEAAKPKKKRVTKAVAKRVYHRDYLRTKNKPYRKYDPEEHARQSVD